jgi:subfamily B ATP-binding cassette protein MsbA
MAMFGRRRRGAKAKKEERELPETPLSWTRLFSYLSPYKMRLFIATLALMGSAVLSLIFPALIGGVGDFPGVLSSVVNEQNFQLLDGITLFLLAVFVIRSFTSFLETYNLNYVGERLVVDIRKQLYSQLQQMSLKFLYG